MKSEPEYIQMMPTRSTRRRIVIATLWFCAGVVLYIMFWGDPESTIHVNMADSAFYLAGTVVIGYAVSAVADNTVVYKRTKPIIMDRSNPNYQNPESFDEWESDDSDVLNHPSGPLD